MAWPDLVRQMDAALIGALGKPAQSITYLPELATVPVPVPGIFDDAYVLVAVGEAGVSSTAPAVFFRLEQLPVDPNGDDPIITVDGVEYSAREVKKDGQGGVVIVLLRT